MLFSYILLVIIATTRLQRKILLFFFHRHYGANGTGKSTLSKVLSNVISSSECNIEWNTGTKEDVIVYNKGFVEKNFQNDIALKGIFSMGEENIEKKKDIEEKKNKIEDEEEIFKNLNNTLNSEKTINNPKVEKVKENKIYETSHKEDNQRRELLSVELTTRQLLLH